MLKKIIQNLQLVICNSIQPKISDYKNEYYLRIVNKSTREVVDVKFNELSDIVKYYRNNIILYTNETYNKNYYIVRKIHKTENMIEL